MSVMLNIAESSGRFTKPDQRHMFVISRSSIFESMALIEILKDDKVLSDEEFNYYYERYKTLSIMIYKMIKKL